MSVIALLAACFAFAGDARRVQNEVKSAFNPGHALQRTGAPSTRHHGDVRLPLCPPDKYRSSDPVMRKANMVDLYVRDKRVVIRTDFSVLQAKDEPSIFTHCIRVHGAIETIRDCLERGAQSVVVMTHMTPPHDRDGSAALTGLGPIAYIMEELLNTPVQWLKSWSGREVNKLCANPEKGTLILLDNLSGNLEEEMQGVDKNGNLVTADPNRVQQFRSLLAKCGDIYVNDAFGVAHLPQSTMLGEGFEIRAAGPELAAEVDGFDKVLRQADAPVLAVVGGTRLVDKGPFIKAMLNKVDRMIIGGSMAHSFMKVMEPNLQIGDPVAWETQLDCGAKWREENLAMAPEIIQMAKDYGVELILPLDYQISSNFSVWGERRYDVTKEEGIPEGFMALDIGPKSILQNRAAIQASKTVIWNGPLTDVYMWEMFENGTMALTEDMIELTARGGTTVVVNVDSYTASRRFGGREKLTHISKSNGMALNALWEGQPLPGVSSLSDREAVPVEMFTTPPPQLQR